MFTENLDGFLDKTNGLAVEALFDVAQTPVKGFFDNEYDEAFGTAGTGPRFVCKSTDIGASGVNKSLVVSGITYTIIGREPIDDGVFVRLPLRKAS